MTGYCNIWDVHYDIETGEFTEKVGFCDLTPNPETGYVCEFCKAYDEAGRPDKVPYKYRDHIMEDYWDEIMADPSNNHLTPNEKWDMAQAKFDIWVAEQESKD